MTLHLVNKAPYSSPALDECLALVSVAETAQAILLIEDAVYAVLPDQTLSDLHARLAALPGSCYVLKEDLVLRGLEVKVPDFFTVVDYAGFVELTLEYAKVQSWS